MKNVICFFKQVSYILIRPVDGTENKTTASPNQK